MSLPVIGFAGMTHLGINSAVASAERGVDVICFDNDSALIASLSVCETQINEPQLTEMMRSNTTRLSFSQDVKALNACDIIYIAPDVATDDDGNSDLSTLNALVKHVEDGVDTNIPIIVLSQVPPGYTREIQAMTDRQIYYQVETLIFGQAIDRALNPERFIVGCQDSKATLHGAFEAYLKLFNCPILPMKYESAELTKISINCCLVASVSVANTLAELCEEIGADWSEIVPALKLDKRIGQYAYLKPGLGLSGGNLERDLSTVIKLAGKSGTDSDVVQAWVTNSQYRKNWTIRTLYQDVLSEIDEPKIAIWGLAYKQDTHSVKNSPSLEFIKYLSPYEITVYDPVVSPSVIDYRQVEAAADALSACEGMDVLAIMTPWSEFSLLSPEEIAARMRGNIVIDPYAMLERDACNAAGLKILTLGIK